MKDTRYAYAVANVRSRENEFLSSSIFEQLISADVLDDVLRILADKGVISADEDADVLADIESKMTEAWEYLREIAPDKDALSFLVVPNDFHNLKTSLKSIVSKSDERTTYYIRPCLVPPESIYNAVASKKFGELPKMLEQAATDGYDILTSTADGQLLDVTIDRYSLKAMCDTAQGDEFTKMLTQELAALYNFKIALRAASTKASEAVCSAAFCECKKTDVRALKNAAVRGVDRVKALMQESGYSDLADKESFSEFEKCCDERILRLLSDSSTVSFGIEPLIAYYFRKSAEVQNLRLIINAKHAGLSQEIIRERMREIYV